MSSTSRYHLIRRLIGITDKTHEHPPMNKGTRLNIAILGDYQNVALRVADWSAVASREIHVTNGGAVNG